MKGDIKQLIKKKLKLIVPIAAGIAVALSVFIIYRHIESGKFIKVSGNIEGDDVRISFMVMCRFSLNSFQFQGISG